MTEGKERRWTGCKIYYMLKIWCCYVAVLSVRDQSWREFWTSQPPSACADIGVMPPTYALALRPSPCWTWTVAGALEVFGHRGVLNC